MSASSAITVPYAWDHRIPVDEHEHTTIKTVTLTRDHLRSSVPEFTSLDVAQKMSMSDGDFRPVQTHPIDIVRFEGRAPIVKAYQGVYVTPHASSGRPVSPKIIPLDKMRHLYDNAHSWTAVVRTAVWHYLHSADRWYRRVNDQDIGMPRDIGVICADELLCDNGGLRRSIAFHMKRYIFHLTSKNQRLSESARSFTELLDRSICCHACVPHTPCADDSLLNDAEFVSRVFVVLSQAGVYPLWYDRQDDGMTSSSLADADTSVVCRVLVGLDTGIRMRLPTVCKQSRSVRTPLVLAGAALDCSVFPFSTDVDAATEGRVDTGLVLPAWSIVPGSAYWFYTPLGTGASMCDPHGRDDTIGVVRSIATGDIVSRGVYGARPSEPPIATIAVAARAVSVAAVPMTPTHTNHKIPEASNSNGVVEKTVAIVVDDADGAPKKKRKAKKADATNDAGDGDQADGGASKKKKRKTKKTGESSGDESDSSLPKKKKASKGKYKKADDNSDDETDSGATKKQKKSKGRSKKVANGSDAESDAESPKKRHKKSKRGEESDATDGSDSDTDAHEKKKRRKPRSSKAANGNNTETGASQPKRKRASKAADKSDDKPIDLASIPVGDDQTRMDAFLRPIPSKGGKSPASLPVPQKQPRGLAPASQASDDADDDMRSVGVASTGHASPTMTRVRDALAKAPMDVVDNFNLDDDDDVVVG
jgi:hypothetical protein